MLRISATIPDHLVAAADQHAQRLDRSRSWVLTEALRQYLSRPATPTEVPEQPRDARTVAAITPSGLGENRLGQLRADLRLSPEERVKEAERTLRLSRRGPRASRQPVIAFASFEDYLEWDRHEGLR